MSDSPTSAPSRGPQVFLGVLAAFASFAVAAAILQKYAGGRPGDPMSETRLKNKAEIAGAQNALLKKYGLTDHGDVVLNKAAAQIKERKLETSKVVVPGSPTATKQAAPAPATPAPATPQPAAPAVQPVTPAPEPVPATPPPAPPLPATNPQ